MDTTVKDVVLIGKERLIGEFQDKTDLNKLLDLLLQEVQTLENLFLNLLDIKDIDSATQYSLDLIGKVVGEQRKGRSDEPYRSAIKLRIKINSANGTYRSVYSILKDYTSSDEVIINRSSKAFGMILLNGQENISGNLYNLLQDIIPAGTRWVIMSDFNNTSFRCVAEKKVAEYEDFYVTTDGNEYLPLEVTLDGVTYSNLITGDEDILNYYPPSVKGDVNKLFYEDAFDFQVTSDGTTYENLIIDTGEDQVYTQMRVIVPYDINYIPDNYRPFPWEVSEDMATLT